MGLVTLLLYTYFIIYVWVPFHVLLIFMEKIVKNTKNLETDGISSGVNR